MLPETLSQKHCLWVEEQNRDWVGRKEGGKGEGKRTHREETILQADELSSKFCSFVCEQTVLGYPIITD